MMKNINYLIFGTWLFLMIFGCVSQNQETYYRGSGLDIPLVTPTPNLDAKIVGCNTNLGFGGETTSIWVTLINSGNGIAEDVSVTFYASDSEENPPTLPIGILPVSKQKTISYAIDTRFGKQTTVRVDINAKNTNTIVQYSTDCRRLDDATVENLNRLVQLGLKTLG